MSPVDTEALRYHAEFVGAAGFADARLMMISAAQELEALHAAMVDDAVLDSVRLERGH